MRSGNARKGSGLLPPNPKQWGNENHALDLRDVLQQPLDVALDVDAAFAGLQGVIVFAHGTLPLSLKYIEHMRADGNGRWSGMAVAFPDLETTVVIYNDSHPRTRIRATLMEEYFHLHLGHLPSRVRLYDERGRLRTHDRDIESEAYGCGVAALLPFRPLKQQIDDGWSARSIADHFKVSKDLVMFRAKVTKQYARLKAR